MYYTEELKIRTSIKGFNHEIKHLNSQLKKSNNVSRRARLDTKISILQREVRHHLLAFAFMKYKPYISVERNCIKPVNSKAIFKIIRDLGPFVRHIYTRGSILFGSDTDLLLAIESWLNGEEVIEKHLHYWEKNKAVRLAGGSV